MHTYDSPGLNVGQLIRDGVALTTREVVALLIEACRDPDGALPRTPDDLWLTATGEVRTSQPEQSATPTDPTIAVADLLETMLPAADLNPEDAVGPPLRGLPARLRAAAGDAGPKVHQDLIRILSVHLDGDSRQVVQQLAQRTSEENVQPVVFADPDLDDFDLNGVDENLTAPRAHVVLPPLPPRRDTRRPLGRIFAAVAAAALFIAIAAGSYWFVRNRVVNESTETAASRSVDNEPLPTPGRVVASTPTDDTTAARRSNSATAATIAAQPAPATAADAGAPQPLELAVNDGAFSPTFGKTGHELFFHAGRSNAGQLLMASLDDNGQVSRVSMLVDEPARNYHPRVSPDGRLLAFDSDRDGERGVYVSERDGSNARRVSGDGYGAVPSWSPDMKRLAFIRAEAQRPSVWNLWVRDVASGAVQRHTSFRSGQVWGASWFPDGRSLCYTHDDRLVISHLDDREDTVIETPRQGHLVRTPAVSPDGRRVVFQVFKDGVWLLDMKTREMRRILDDPGAEEFSWAPDGRRIAYHTRRDGAWKIWVMNVPG